MGKVVITKTNGQLGASPDTSDSVAVLCCTGAGTGTIALNTPIAVFSQLDAETKGFTVAVEPFAHRHIAEFYSEAPDGSELWVMLVVNTVLLAQMATLATVNGAKKVIDATNGRARLVGIARNPPGGYAPAAQFLDADAVNAVPLAQLMVADYFTKFSPIVFCVEGRVVDVAHATVFTPNTQAASGVAMVLGSSAADGGACVGLALGRLAKNKVQRNAGAVEDGPLGISAAYIGTKTIEQLFNEGSLDSFTTNTGGKGYMSLYKYAQKAGYYFSDDPTCVVATDDYKTITNNRVINKAEIITYQTYVEKVNTDVLIDDAGKLDAGVAKSLEGQIDNAINTAMVGEISSVQSYIDVDQNILATGKLGVVLKIIPKGYLKEINAKLGFSNPTT